MCQKWELGIQSFYYSSQTYSMQVLKKDVLRLYKACFIHLPRRIFLSKFSFKKLAVKNRNKKKYILYSIDHCTFPFFIHTKMFCVLVKTN